MTRKLSWHERLAGLVLADPAAESEKERAWLRREAKREARRYLNTVLNIASPQEAVDIVRGEYRRAGGSDVGSR